MSMCKVTIPPTPIPQNCGPNKLYMHEKISPNPLTSLRILIHNTSKKYIVYTMNAPSLSWRGRENCNINKKNPHVPQSHTPTPDPHPAPPKKIYFSFSLHIIPQQYPHNPTTTTKKMPPPPLCRLITAPAEELVPIPNVTPSAPLDDECEPPLLVAAAAVGVAVAAPADDDAAAAAAAGLLPSLATRVGYAGGLAVRNCAAMVGIGPHWVPLSSNFQVWEGQ